MPRATRTTSWSVLSTTKSSRPFLSSKSTRRLLGASSGQLPAIATVSSSLSALVCSPNGLVMPWSRIISPACLRLLVLPTTRPSWKSTGTCQSCNSSQPLASASLSTRSVVARCSSLLASVCWCHSSSRLSDPRSTPRQRALQLAMQSSSSFSSTSSSTIWASAVSLFHTRQRFCPTGSAPR